jgi:Domain of unknown function (DUF6702)
MISLIASTFMIIQVYSHPFHITIAEAEYNPDSKKLEISMRIYQPLDLELILSKRIEKPVNLEKTANIDDLIADYLSDVFIVEYPDTTRAKIEYIGKEVTLKTVWIYFEVELKNGPEDMSFRDRILFEIESDQTNSIIFRHGKRRRSLFFNTQNDHHKFKWSDH